MEQVIWQNFKDDDFVLFGIDFVENEDIVREFVENLQLTFPILLDSNGQTYSKYLMEFCQDPFPQDYIIDQDGSIAYKACEYFPDSMTTVIETLLGGAPSSVPEPWSPGIGGPQIDLIWPNPIATTGRIAYTVPSDAETRVEIIDATGRRIRALWDGRQEAGSRVVVWNGQDRAGRPVASGAFFVRISARGQNTSRKIFIVR